MTRRFPVTEHAVMRYLERVQGVDLDAIREKICTPAVRAACKMGAKQATIDGFAYVIEDHQIITIHPAKHDPLGPRRYRERNDD